MPTGYTADVVTGKLTDFRTFALQCARAFGACIMQRDDPMDEPPKLREVSEYYRTAVTSARAELAAFTVLGMDELKAQLDREHAEAVASWEARQREAALVVQHLDGMTSDVKAWTPPTPEHQGLKDFMLQQLAETRKYDGTAWGEAPVKRTPLLYAADRIRQLESAVERSEESLRDEEKRCAEQNAWITALYASLTREVAA